MSRLTLTYLTCDHDGCNTQWPEQPAARIDRRDARLAGWTTRGGRDLCPDHNTLAPLVRSIRQMAAARMSDTRIAQHVGYSPNGVWQIRQRYGIPGLPWTRHHPLAVCAVCGGPTPGALADCPNPTCVAETIRIEMAHVRREDQ